MSSAIGLFYGSSTCYTEMAAEKICAQINSQHSDSVRLHNIADQPLSLMADYNLLILGIPTWDYGELQEDWESHWDELEQIDFTGKRVAVYGLGDQIGYPEWFQDALGYLWAKVKNRGATMVGEWPNQGYEFDQSKALTDNKAHFVGLALDDENQLDLSDDYINRWCMQICSEFGLGQ
ncbi:flavodoxin FldB [SAR92 clade bacterium H455]|jgi:flavodoxin II|uniref:Flavodoxin n=1 Tax=SAR92 clade bacterium H455 TaxID=2974818 RepID=A0ABY5TPA9_9GAMM|nr:flavodoxin FldB [SAR92 clade bacterium H455]